MKQSSRFASLILGLAALLQGAVQVEAATHNLVIRVQDGPNPVVGATGNYGYLQYTDAQGHSTTVNASWGPTDTNGYAPTNTVTESFLAGVVTANIQSLPPGMKVQNPVLTNTIPTNGSASVPVTFNVTSGTIAGYVLFGDGTGVPHALLTGSISGQTGTASHGEYIVSTDAAAQTVTPSLAGYTFTPASATVYPGITKNFTVATGPCTGNVSAVVVFIGGSLLFGLPGVTILSNQVPVAVTDTNGMFSFNGSGGAISFSAPGYTFSPASTNIYPGVPLTNMLAVASGPIFGAVTSGGFGVAGVTVTKGVTNVTTDANGSFSIAGQTGGVVTFAKTGYVFSPTSISLFPGVSNSVTVTSGPITGKVVADSIGIANVTITSGTNTITTDVNGNFSFANGASRLVTPSLPAGASNTFSPASATIYPGIPQTFQITAGTIAGTITGAAASNAVVVISDGLANHFTNLPTGSGSPYGYQSSLLIDAGQLFTVTPSKRGYHFSPAAIMSPLGVNGVNFTIGTAPPGFTFPVVGGVNFSFAENQGPITIVPGNYQTSGDLPPGYSTIVSVTSGNANVIPNTTNSIALVGSIPNQSIVFTPIPGSTGNSVITLVVSDGINPNVTTNFTIKVAATAQFPIVGMPVALNFNGTNNYLRVTNFASIAPSNEVTVEFWENVGQPSQHSTLVLAHDNTSNRFGITAPLAPQLAGNAYGTVYWDFGNINAAGRLGYALPKSVVNQWTHFAFVSSQSNNTMQIYMNGSLVASKIGGGSFTNYLDDLLLDLPGTNGFGGAISDFRVWNKALAGSNILQTMNNPLIGNEPGLVLYYRFNENSGITLHDSTATKLNAAVLGDAPYPTWVAAPTNFMNFTVRAFTSSNSLYLPAYIQDVASTKYKWFIISNANLNGTLTQVSAGQWDYVPSASFASGTASFVYSVNSGAATLSNATTVNITVNALNPPVLSSIPNQLAVENSPVPPIIFTITDTNLGLGPLITNVSCDNPNLLDPLNPFIITNVSQLGNTNETEALILYPAANTIGSANITVSVNDGYNVVSQQFVFKINQAPAYTIVDLGVLPNRFASYGAGINNLGQIVGYSTDKSEAQNQKQAFLYTGFAGSGQLVALQTNTGQQSAAYAINDNSQITGFFQPPSGGGHIFFYDYINNPVLVDFGNLSGVAGAYAIGLALNNNAVVAGYGTTATGQYHAVESQASLVDLGLKGGTNFATGINDAGQIVGYYVTNNNLAVAFIVTPSATNNVAASTNYLGFLPGGTNGQALAINASGDVVGASYITNGFPHAWFKPSGGGMQDLGLPSGMLGATAYGLNGFDQVVGTAVTGNGISHAFLYSTGQMLDLNNLLPYEETNTWVLTDAHGISDDGSIVGTGIIGGQTHAFLALPAWVIGQPIAPPLGTVAQAPVWTVLSGPNGTASQFYWDPTKLLLYPIVPCTAEIQWATSYLNPK